jgi:hypothetical protein
MRAETRGSPQQLHQLLRGRHAGESAAEDHDPFAHGSRPSFQGAWSGTDRRDERHETVDRRIECRPSDRMGIMETAGGSSTIGAQSSGSIG